MNAVKITAGRWPPIRKRTANGARKCYWPTSNRDARPFFSESEDDRDDYSHGFIEMKAATVWS